MTTDQPWLHGLALARAKLEHQQAKTAHLIRDLGPAASGQRLANRLRLLTAEIAALNKLMAQGQSIPSVPRIKPVTNVMDQNNQAHGQQPLL